MTRARLIGVDRGDNAPSEFRFKGAEITVGSEPGNSLVLKHATVSRRHALIRRLGKRFEIADLKSTNGTFINGHRLQVPTFLEDRAEVKFGGVDFVFLDPRIRARSGSRGTTRLRTKVRRVLEAVSILFLIGFGITQYLLNGDNLTQLLRRMMRASPPTATIQRVAPATEAKLAAKSEPQIQPKVASGSPAVVPLPHEPTITAGPTWLRRLNYYRQLAGLAPVNENDALSDGDYKHARYIVENYASLIKAGGSLGGAVHTEDSDKPWYTPEGFAAANNSALYEGCSTFDPQSAIDGWTAAPFHRLAILGPNLTSVGFGRYQKGGCWTMGLDSHFGPELKGLARPIEFPPPGATVALEFVNDEWPDPLTACSQYMPPTGLPITLELGPGAETKLGAHSLFRGGTQVEHCAYDASSYSNADGFGERAGRDGLKALGVVMMIPRQPLVPGETYAVSIEAQGKTYSWSFKVASKDERVAGN